MRGFNTLLLVSLCPRGFEHMGKVFGMASRDPTSVGYIMREDIVRVNEDKMLMLA